MGLDDSVEEQVGSSPTPPPAPDAEQPAERLEEEVQVSRVLWCCCVRVEGDVQLREACLVLTDRWLGLLYPSHDFLRTNQDTGEHTLLYV